MTSRGGQCLHHLFPHLARKGGSGKGGDFLQFTFHVDRSFSRGPPVGHKVSPVPFEEVSADP